MKSDILVSLIKEVVKNEVKNQVKEELAKLVKSGAVVLNSNKVNTNKLSEITKPATQFTKKAPTKAVKEITKNPILNEILNQTEPFTAAQRSSGNVPMAATGGSILDAIQPNVSMEGDWETMDYRGTNMPETPINTDVDNVAVDALTKALKRDYRELVKRF